MRLVRLILYLALVVLVAPLLSASAASLRVSPVSFDLVAPAQTAAITLSNTGAAPVNAQVRIFRWTQTGGQDQLTDTQDVIASPPAATIPMNQDQLIRLVRVSGQPLVNEECYRLLVDELPTAAAPGHSVIDFVIRYSIPVFFANANSAAKLQWTARASAGSLTLSASNTGNRHVRISELAVTSANGTKVVFSAGLVGYVLPGSVMEWSKPIKPGSGFTPGTSISLSAHGEGGAINETVPLQTKN